MPSHRDLRSALLQHLDECAQRGAQYGVELLELPNGLLDAETLTACDVEGAIEFGRRRRRHDGSGHKVDLEAGFEPFSNLASLENANGGQRTIADILAEERKASDDRERFRPLHVRITQKGRSEAARNRTEAEASEGVRTVEFVATLCAVRRCPQFSDPRLQQYWNALWSERLRVFGRVFPWVQMEILRLAGLPRDTRVGPDATHEINKAFIAAHEQYSLGSRSGCDQVIAIHERQNREWEELTNVPPLTNPGDWLTAAIRAGAFPGIQFNDAEDFGRYAGTIVAWALDRQTRAVPNRLTKVEADQTNDFQDRKVPFAGGHLVRFNSHFELCGVEICAGDRAADQRAILAVLSRSENGQFKPYAAEDLAKELIGLDITHRDVPYRIKSLRKTISRELAKAGIECGQDDVILSGGPGYRLKDWIVVDQSVPQETACVPTDTTTMSVPVDVPDVSKGGVPNVPNPDVPDVPNVPDPDEDGGSQTKRCDWIVERLTAGLKVGVSDVTSQFGVARKTAQRDFNLLKDRGRVEFVGEPRTGYYRLLPPAKP